MILQKNGYIQNILSLKMEKFEKEFKAIEPDYQKFQSFTVGKLDTRDMIEKNMTLLAISRKLFTHSIPLIVAEQCYKKLLKDARILLQDTKIANKRERAYSLLITLIEEYNVKLLSTKVYWEDLSQREEYKKFWDKFKEIDTLKEKNYDEYIKQKEILFIRSDLEKVSTNENKYYKIIKFYKNKLVELGVMRNLYNSYISEGVYTKVTKKTKKRKVRKEAV